MPMAEAGTRAKRGELAVNRCRSELRGSPVLPTIPRRLLGRGERVAGQQARDSTQRPSPHRGTRVCAPVPRPAADRAPALGVRRIGLGLMGSCCPPGLGGYRGGLAGGPGGSRCLAPCGHRARAGYLRYHGHLPFPLPPCFVSTA